MYTTKYITTEEKPNKFDKINNNSWYYNYNITETDDNYSFVQVRINGEPNFTNCFNAVLKAFEDEDGINLYDVLLMYGTDNQIQEIEQNLKMDFETCDDLQKAKNKILQKISEYDLCDSVRKLIINHIEGWYDKYQRTALRDMVKAQQNIGQDITTLWFGDDDFLMSCDTALDILNKLEIYATKCLNTTKKHRQKVNNLSTISEVENYNYKSGYPEVLEFEV